MSDNAILSHTRRRDLVTRFAVTAWIILLAVVSVRCAVWPRVHSVYPVYARAGQDWLRGDSLYFQESLPHRTQYRYSPFTVLLLMPLQFLPESVGGVAGRLVSAAVFLLGLAWWLNRGIPHQLPRRLKAAIMLLALPIVVGSLNNGQLNFLVAGLLLVGTTATLHGWRWLGGMCLAIAIAVKIYPIAVALLLCAVFPRKLVLPLAACLLAVAGLPFLFQRFDYVLGQYFEWYQVLAIDDRKFLDAEIMYRDLWLVFHDFHIPMTASIYVGLQLVSALLSAILCLRAKARGWSDQAVAAIALIAGTCWMLLCGPATENCTYTMLAPVIGYLVVVAIRPESWAGLLRHVPALAYIALFALTFTGILPPEARNATRAAAPTATLVLSIGYVLATLRALKQGPIADRQSPTLQRAA